MDDKQTSMLPDKCTNTWKSGPFTMRCLNPAGHDAPCRITACSGPTVIWVDAGCPGFLLVADPIDPAADAETVIAKWLQGNDCSSEPSLIKRLSEYGIPRYMIAQVLMVLDEYLATHDRVPEPDQP